MQCCARQVLAEALLGERVCVPPCAHPSRLGAAVYAACGIARVRICGRERWRYRPHWPRLQKPPGMPLPGGFLRLPQHQTPYLCLLLKRGIRSPQSPPPILLPRG